MKSVEDLPPIFTFQGKPEHETTTENFETFHPNHSLTPKKKKKGKNQIK
jgi:hypothetical protein